MAASSVLMVEPKDFISNPQTIGDNFFQVVHSDIFSEEINQKAFEEFQGLRMKLEEAGIKVKVFRYTDDLNTPDAIYPNNWFSTHRSKTVVLYPMLAPNRRLERRPAIVNQLKSEYSNQIDLSANENRGLYLEGTGSLAIDHENKVAYASLSERTSTNLLFEWSRLLNYELVLFTSYSRDNKIVYHTNVVMCIGGGFAIVCFDAIKDYDEKRQVQAMLKETNHELIKISLDQMHYFCANCLELQNAAGERFLVMSEEAFLHFTPEQINTIKQRCSIIHADLSTIERYGGGGARCMLAELF
jgi:hypothetical protein